MIEFNGYLSGAAEKRFIYKSRMIGFLVFALWLPCGVFTLLFVANNFFQDIRLFYAMLLPLSFLVIVFFATLRKKHILQMMPKRIYTDGEHIVCVADRYTESRLICDVTKMVDHGEFYELCFPFGNFTNKFICQKSLLKVGTLESFEALFAKK